MGDLGGVAEGRRLHELEVLLILGGRAGGDFIDPFADVGACEAGKAGEGGEELVVAAEAGHGHEAAQGEGVDETVVEVLVGGGHVAGEGGGGDELAGAGGLGEFESGGVDAEAVLGGVADEGFRVDGAGEVDVEVGAFGELGEEGAQGERALVLIAEEGACGAGFGLGDVRLGRMGAGGKRTSAMQARRLAGRRMIAFQCSAGARWMGRAGGAIARARFCAEKRSCYTGSGCF